MMYHKFIGDREVFSDCKTIQLEDGRWVSNPSEEQIAAAGWEPYTPPIVPPQPELEPDDYTIIQAVKTMLASSTDELSDEDAIEVAALFPTWISKMGEDVSAGERLWYDGELWKVLQPHTVQETWTPPTSPSLFVKVSIEEIPEWVQPVSAETAYHKDDKVKHNKMIWQSIVDNNTWEPGVYGWVQL